MSNQHWLSNRKPLNRTHLNPYWAGSSSTLSTTGLVWSVIRLDGGSRSGSMHACVI